MSDRYPGGIEDPTRFRELVELFEEREQRNYYYESALETVEEHFSGEWYRSDELVLGGPMLLLYTWNFAAPGRGVRTRIAVATPRERGVCP